MLQKNRPLLFMVIFSAGAFLFDLSQPLGVAAGIPHLGLVLIALALPGSRSLYLAAAAASSLTMGKLALLGGADVTAAVVANRTLSVAAFWGVAAALDYNRRRAQRAEHNAVEGRLALEQREAELRRLRELEAIAAGIAHHFNNAMNAAIGITDLLADRYSAEGVVQLQDIHWRVANLVREFQVGFDDNSGAPVAVALRDVIQDACAASAVEVQFSAATDARVLVWGRGLTAAVEAVLENAGEAGGGRPVRISCADSLPSDPRPSGWLLSPPDTFACGVFLSIEDDGPGMDAETASRTGEPFFTTKGPERLGLGLVRARSAVLLHGGAMEISSAPAKGTRVTLWLPAVS